MAQARGAAEHAATSKQAARWDTVERSEVTATDIFGIREALKYELVTVPRMSARLTLERGGTAGASTRGTELLSYSQRIIPISNGWVRS